jgi:hypothetical protein
MKAASKLKDLAGEKWIPAIYADKVRTRRTRAFVLGVPGRENEAEILHTLLGIELKVGRRRLSCPDLSTARYLRTFARLGVSEAAVPYDISKLAALADEFESGWQYLLLLLEQEFPGQKRIRSGVIKSVRQEIAGIGAGEAMPEFKQTTRQEKYHRKDSL